MKNIVIRDYRGGGEAEVVPRRYRRKTGSDSETIISSPGTTKSACCAAFHSKTTTVSVLGERVTGKGCEPVGIKRCLPCLRPAYTSYGRRKRHPQTLRLRRLPSVRVIPNTYVTTRTPAFMLRACGIGMKKSRPLSTDEDGGAFSVNLLEELCHARVITSSVRPRRQVRRPFLETSINVPVSQVFIIPGNRFYTKYSYLFCLKIIKTIFRESRDRAALKFACP